MMTTSEAPNDETMLVASVPEPQPETDDGPLFPSLDGERNLLTALWRDADLLG